MLKHINYRVLQIKNKSMIDTSAEDCQIGEKNKLQCIVQTYNLKHIGPQYYSVQRIGDRTPSIYPPHTYSISLQDSCLRLLLDVVSKQQQDMPDFSDTNLNTPAHAAAKHGHISCLQVHNMKQLYFVVYVFFNLNYKKHT